MVGRGGVRRAPTAAILVVVCLTAACSSKNQSAQGGGNATAATNPACNGAPLKFASIGSLTGPLALPSLVDEAQHATTAALKAVNNECALGRPIEVDVCDDKGDPNEAQKCGREAKDSGALAFLGSAGGFDTGTTAAGLPGVLTGGNTLFDLTNENSFSSSSGLTLVVGGAGATAAAGVHDALMVVTDSSAARAFIGIAQQVAQNAGVNMDAIYVPPDTTDFAPVAAQVSERKPSAIGLVIPSPVPFINALNAEGITPKDVPTFTAVTLMSPEVLKQLGSKADGMYLLTQQAPPSDKDNPGVQQMLAELKDAGFDANGDELSPASTGSWSSIHALVDILKKAPPGDISTMDSAKLVAAMKNAGPINRPETAPFDFTKPAFGDIPALANFRIFSREAMLVRIENGHYVRASSFSDATQPFKLDS